MAATSFQELTESLREGSSQIIGSIETFIRFAEGQSDLQLVLLISAAILSLAVIGLRALFKRPPAPEPVTEDVTHEEVLEEPADEIGSVVAEKIPSSEPLQEPIPAEEIVRRPAQRVEIAAEEPLSILERFRQGLEKTRSRFKSSLDEVFRRGALDQDAIDRIEEILYGADLGPAATQDLVNALDKHKDVDLKKDNAAEQIKNVLKQELVKILDSSGNRPSRALAPEEWKAKPHVILVVGVNGSGKTTSIGKLAHRFRQEGKKVLLGAGDTFRAAAAEQLGIWGERTGSEVVSQSEGADPGSVAFDAVSAAKARGADVVIVDTAGRLHTKSNLMEELAKVKRVIQKVIPEAPHEALLVIDAVTGQNALKQAQEFDQKIGVDGLVLTKLDGTARGGSAVAITKTLGIPIHYIGVGEGVFDLQPFEPESFAEALLD
jgi:fused signal recognition particle receptor